MNPIGWLSRSLSEIFTGPSHKPYHAPTPEEDKEKFFDAIAKEDLTTMTSIASRYKDFLSWRNDEGQSPLHYAQDQSSFQAFVQLVGMGADRHEDYGNGWNPLIVALARRHTTFVDYLLDGDQKTLNSVATDGSHSFTSLHLAVDLGDEEHIVKMIQKGADTTIKAMPGKTELTAGEYAAARHKKAIAEIFDLAPTIRAQYEQDAAAMRAAMAVPPPAPKPEPVLQSPFRGVTAAAA